MGASKLLGLPREKIIGRRLDDFAEPTFKPVISERWRAFLETGQQEGTLESGLDRTELPRRGRVPRQRESLTRKKPFGVTGQVQRAG